MVAVSWKRRSRRGKGPIVELRTEDVSGITIKPCVCVRYVREREREQGRRRMCIHGEDEERGETFFNLAKVGNSVPLIRTAGEMMALVLGLPMVQHAACPHDANFSLLRAVCVCSV